jgi:nucleoside 2-deoxyribosyltransferase
MTQPLRIYLAGPEVFLPEAKEMGEKKKALCLKYGFMGKFPLDNELILDDKPHENGLKISRANEELIDGCQLVIANITPFRGPSADAGTIFEIGYACARGLPVFAYSNTKVLFTERTVSYFGLSRDPATGVIRDHHHMNVENFTMVENLMIDGGIEASKGKIFRINVPEDELYTNLKGFKACLNAAYKLFAKP